MRKAQTIYKAALISCTRICVGMGDRQSQQHQDKIETKSRIFNGINSCVLYLPRQKTKARSVEELGDRIPHYSEILPRSFLTTFLCLGLVYD